MIYFKVFNMNPKPKVPFLIFLAFYMINYGCNSETSNSNSKYEDAIARTPESQRNEDARIIFEEEGRRSATYPYEWPTLKTQVFSMNEKKFPIPAVVTFTKTTIDIDGKIKLTGTWQTNRGFQCTNGDIVLVTLNSISWVRSDDEVLSWSR